MATEYILLYIFALIIIALPVTLVIIALIKVRDITKDK